jgi:uncharacterized membrane protein
MINIERSIIIHRSVEEVFHYVSNLTHSAEWQNGLTEVRQITDRPLGVGTQYALVRTFLGRKLEASNEITEFTPNVKVAFKTISGPIPLEASYQFEPAENGTKFTSKIKMQPRGFVSLAEPLISASLQRDVEDNLGVLKNMLENRTTAVSMSPAA